MFHHLFNWDFRIIILYIFSIHQERLIIVKRPGNHHHHHGHTHGHNHDHAHGHGHDHHYAHLYNHGGIGHGYSKQESRIPSVSGDIRPLLNFYQSQQSNSYPFFQDVGFLLDPRLAQQSAWLDQFPDMFW